jgi:hypothetical protein
MNTEFEALMKAMLLHGWFTKSNGDDASPLGFFGYVSNKKEELNEIYKAFSGIVEVYGYPAEEDMVGYFYAMIHSSGVVHIVRKDTLEEAENSFWNTNEEYNKWLGDDDDE